MRGNFLCFLISMYVLNVWGGAFVYVMCGSWDASSTQRRESEERRDQLSYTHVYNPMQNDCMSCVCMTIELVDLVRNIHFIWFSYLLTTFLSVHLHSIFIQIPRRAKENFHTRRGNDSTRWFVRPNVHEWT